MTKDKALTGNVVIPESDKSPEREFFEYDPHERRWIPAVWNPLLMSWPSLRPGDPRINDRFRFDGSPDTRPYINAVNGPWHASNATGKLSALHPGFVSRFDDSHQMLATILGECHMILKTLLHHHEQLGQHKKGIQELLEFTTRAMLETCHASEDAAMLKQKNAGQAHQVEWLKKEITHLKAHPPLENPDVDYVI